MKVLVKLIIVALIVFMGAITYGETENRSAVILDMEGKVEVARMSADRISAEVGMELSEGDILLTKADSWAYVRIDGIKQASVEVKENSQLLFSEMIMDKEKGTQMTLLDLALGKVMVTVQELPSDKPNFEVKTPTTVVGTMGDTESIFSVEVESLE